MKTLHLYIHFIRVYIKCKAEYRLSFICELAANFIMLWVYYLGIWILFRSFDNIAGWNYGEILFLFNINWFCYSISGFFLWSPMLSMGKYIQSGEYDMFLIRPMRTLTYLVFRQFQYTFSARCIMSFGFLIWSMKIINLDWNLIKGFYFFISILLGILIYSGIFVIIGALSFWIIKNEEIGNVIVNNDNGLRTFSDYPLAIYNKGIRFILTVIIPFALVNYYPASYLLYKNNILFSLPQVYEVGFAFGIVMVALFIWHLGGKKYNSTGT